MALILTIIFSLTAILGFYCLIKPDNFLLPYAMFYYNPKRPFVEFVRLRGEGLGARHIKKFGKTKGILWYMRIFGLVLLLISVLLIIQTI